MSFVKSAFCITALLIASGYQSVTQTTNNTTATIANVPQAHSVRIPTKKGQPHPEALVVKTHERFATFLADENFISELLLQNNRMDAEVTARPALILGGTEVALAPVTLSPHGTASLDINAALRARGLHPTRGVVVVRYDFNTYAALSAVITASDLKHDVYLNFSAQSAEEFWSGNSFDGVVWAPDDDTEGFISIINTYSEPAAVQTAFTLNDRTQEQQRLVIAPHQQALLRIDSLLKRSSRTGAAGGVHLEFTGDPGQIIAEGALMNKRTGFAKHIQFTDKALHFATSSQRTHFLLLGRQPVEDGFPGQVSFRSVAAIQNIDSGPVQVTPIVKFLSNGSLQKITLDAINLSVNESRLVDFAQEQASGRLPADFVQGSLELVPNTDHTSIVSELFNFDATTHGYVVGPSFGAHPMRSTTSIWRTDGSFQTTVVIENTAGFADQVTLDLFSGQGTYEKVIDVPAGALIKINVKDLQQNGIRDKSGKLLQATSGTLHLSGSHGGRSALAFDKLIHSADDSEYVGLPAQPCDFVTDFSPFLDGDVNPYSPFITEFWTDGTDDTVEAFPGSENSTLVTVGTDQFGNPLVLVNGSPDGVSHTVGLDFTDIVLDCTACSTRQQEHTLPVSVPACPTSMAVSRVSPFQLNNGTSDGSFPQLKSGIGAVALMSTIPSTNNIPITESVSLLFPSALCPNFPGHNICKGNDTFITGASLQGSAFGVPTPPVPGSFYDFHEFIDPTSVLDVAGINSCSFQCAQSYSCTGRTVGNFQIMYSLTKGNIQGTPVTNVTVTKQ